MPRLDYETHKEKSAERGRNKSLAGRDIYPVPPIEHPYRRRQARMDLKYFCESYFPKKFSKPFGLHHLKFIERLEHVMIKGGKQAIAMPRGSGKSTLMTVAIAWALLFGYVKFIVVVAKNRDEANKFVDSIKAALRKNREILADFPEAAHPIRKLKGSALLARGQLYMGEPTEIGWTADTIRLPLIPGSPSAGSTVSVAGLQAAIRGKFAEGPDGETYRPDLVVIDDPQSDKVAKSPAQVAWLETVVNGAIEGLAEDGKHLSMIMTCTVIRPDDAADRFLDRNIYPHWNGLRYKMLENFPEKMELWEEYRGMRVKDVEAANRFYKKNRKAMDKGAIVAWEESYDDRYEISALQYAMNLWCDDEASFYAERQNEPLSPDLGDVLVDPKTVRSRINGLERGIVPNNAPRLTAFVDVHDNLLYWSVCAWSNDFTGYVIDYGTFPEQDRDYFTQKEKTLITLRRQFPGTKREGAIQAGLEFLCGDLISREWEMESGGSVYLTRLLIDSGYLPQTVDRAITRLRSPVVKPSRGRHIGAKHMPMSEFRNDETMIPGHHWIETLPRRRSHRTISIDTNYWKADVHDSFSASLGEIGGMSIFGTTPELHKMFADHFAGEAAVFVESGKNKVYEFIAKPGKPDNHFFDCMVGCKAAASSIGIKTREEQDMPTAARLPSVENLD